MLSDAFLVFQYYRSKLFKQDVIVMNFQLIRNLNLRADCKELGKSFLEFVFYFILIMIHS